MKTSKKRREAESSRKAERKMRMRPFLRLMKQMLYYQRTGKWEYDPSKLHWHHVDPSQKTRKICHLVTRHPRRIARELRHCEVVHEKEHWQIHGTNVLRTR